MRPDFVSRPTGPGDGIACRRRRRVLGGLLWSGLAAGFPRGVAAQPADRANAFLMAVFDEITAPGGFDLEALIARHAALEDIAGFLLDPDLRRMTGGQRRSVTAALPRWLAERYGEVIGDLSETEITVLDVRPSRIRGVKITTRMLWPDGRDLEMDWHIVEDADGPKLLDLILAGDSMLKRERLLMLDLLDSVGGDPERLIAALGAGG